MRSRRASAATGSLRSVSARDTAVILAQVLGPLVAQGVIARRRHLVAFAQRLQTDDVAVRRLQKLRGRHGPGPLVLRHPGRTVAIVLDPDDAVRVLEKTPDPFAPDSFEKRRALEQFQPHGVLLSHGAARTDRRRLNEAALQPDRAVTTTGPGSPRCAGRRPTRSAVTGLCPGTRSTRPGSG